MRKSVFDKRVSSLFIVIWINLILFICPDSVESLCEGVGPNGDEDLKNICDWSSWYPWNCTPCKSSNTNRQQFKKRAICCAEHVQLKSCLRNCNFSATSDTQYANCSKGCDFNNGSLEIKSTGTTLSTSTNKQNSNKTLDFNTTVATTPSTQAALANSNSYPSIKGYTASKEYISARTSSNGASSNSSLSATSDAENVSVGVVLGAVCGSLIGIAAILIAIILLLKRTKWKRRSSVEPDNSSEN